VPPSEPTTCTVPSTQDDGRQGRSEAPACAADPRARVREKEEVTEYDRTTRTSLVPNSPSHDSCAAGSITRLPSVPSVLDARATRRGAAGALLESTTPLVAWIDPALNIDDAEVERACDALSRLTWRWLRCRRRPYTDHASADPRISARRQAYVAGCYTPAMASHLPSRAHRSSRRH